LLCLYYSIHSRKNSSVFRFRLAHIVCCIWKSICVFTEGSFVLRYQDNPFRNATHIYQIQLDRLQSVFVIFTPIWIVMILGATGVHKLFQHLAVNMWTHLFYSQDFRLLCGRCMLCLYIYDCILREVTYILYVQVTTPPYSYHIQHQRKKVNHTFHFYY